MLFHPTELAGIEATRAETLTSAGRRIAVSDVSDGVGGSVEETATGDEFPCRIAPVSASEQLMANQVQSRTLYRLFVPAGFQIGAGDRVLVDGVEHEVQGRLTTASPDDLGAVVLVYRVE